MQTSERSPLTTYSFERARALMQAAWAAYKLGQCGQASELFAKALQINEALDWTEGIVECRTWGAISLNASSRPRQALATLAPLLQAEAPSSKHADYYLALKTYVRIAQSIPASLASIELAYERIEQFLRDCGHIAWRSDLFLLRADLLELRNREAEALQLAQESWACRQDDAPGAIADGYLSRLVSLSRQVRDRPLAQRYLDEWQRLPDVRPLYRERSFSLQQSWIARWDRRLDDALEWARRALAATERSDTLINLVGTGGALVRAYLCLGEAERARPILARILGRRHAQSIHTRFAVQQLHGDFYLALAREAAGMPPADDSFNREFPVPNRIGRQGIVRDSLQRARGAYAGAMREGCVIDDKLECHGHQDNIGQRLERVAAIEERLN